MHQEPPSPAGEGGFRRRRGTAPAGEGGSRRRGSPPPAVPVRFRRRKAPLTAGEAVLRRGVPICKGGPAQPSPSTFWTRGGSGDEALIGSPASTRGRTRSPSRRRFPSSSPAVGPSLLGPRPPRRGGSEGIWGSPIRPRSKRGQGGKRRRRGRGGQPYVGQHIGSPATGLHLNLRRLPIMDGPLSLPIPCPSRGDLRKTFAGVRRMIPRRFESVRRSKAPSSPLAGRRGNGGGGVSRTRPPPS